MEHYFMEIKDNRIFALHVTTSKTKPDPREKGNKVIPISELAYCCFQASHGSKARILAMLENFDWIEGDEE